MTLIEPLEARSQAEEGPIDARGRVNTSTGRGKREAKAEAEVEALEARLRVGSKTGNDARDADEEPIKHGLVRHPGVSPKRDLTSGRGDSYRREAEPARWGGTSRREAEPIRISSSRGGHRREAKTIDQSKKNPGGGPKRRDAAAHPGRLDIGKGHDRRDADAEAIGRSIGVPEGNSNTNGVAVSNEAPADRGRIVTWPRTRDAEASNDVVARGKGVPWTPKRDAEAIKINSPGGHRREAEPIKRATEFPTGGSDTDSLAISNEALTERGHNVPWGGKRAAEPADDLAERDRGSRWGGRKHGLIRHPGGSPKRGLTPGHSDYPRDAAPIRVALGGCRRDAAAQPGRIGTGITCGRRDAAAESIEARQRMSSGTGRGRRRDAIPRDLRGDDAVPRGVRPGNGNNERDVTAETVEARGRFRGNSRLV